MALPPQFAGSDQSWLGHTLSTAYEDYRGYIEHPYVPNYLAPNRRLQEGGIWPTYQPITWDQLWWIAHGCLMFTAWGIVLPIGVQGQFEDDGDVVEGSEAGAPKEPMLKKKAIWATGGAIVLTLIAHFAVVPWLAGQ